MFWSDCEPTIAIIHFILFLRIGKGFLPAIPTLAVLWKPNKMERPLNILIIKLLSSETCYILCQDVDVFIY